MHITGNRRKKIMSHGFTSIGTAMEGVLKRAQAMSKRYENSSEQENHSTDTDCLDCKDTGMLLETREVEYYGKMIKKDFGRPCHCLKNKNLKARFKNALIPSEFKNARFD